MLTLDVAARNGSLIVLIPSASCAGSVATAVRVAEVASDRGSARVIGIGRCLVDGVAGKSPRLRVRVSAMPDEPLEPGSPSLERAREAAEAIESLWERAATLSERVRELQLQARLRSLGSAASSALLAIPLEQQLELSKGAGNSAGGNTSPSSRAAEPGIDEALGAGVSLTEQVRAALGAQPSDALALAPPSADAGTDAAAAAAEATPLAPSLSSAELSLFSFVALRLTRKSAEDPDDFLEEQPDPRAPTIRQAEGVDALSRLALCRTRLERRVGELQAQASLLALSAPPPADEE